MRTFIRNVRVLTMDENDTVIDRANILIDGDRIVAVAPDAAFADAGPVHEIDGNGRLAMPGLVNAHFHSPVNHLKGSLDSLPLEVFMLYESPALDAAALSPRAAYVRTMLGALEMLKNGVTSVQDDAFFVPSPSPETIDAVMQAYADSGIRATVALDQPNVPELEKLPFLADMLPPELKADLAAPAPMCAEGLLECYRYLIHRWHGAADGRISAAVSCSAPQRVTVDYFEALDALSRAHDLPFYVHMLETKLQRVLGEEKFGGRSLVRYVHDLGLLSDRMNIIHAVWIDDRDVAMIAEAGTVVAHNPISNLRLGSGIMPFRRLRDAGVPICLGTDEAIADDAINMWLVAKMVGLIHNITDPDYERWPTATEVLDCLIRGGAKAMRQERRVGRLAPGYQADLILLDLDTLPFTPLNDLKRQLVYCESGGSVRMTMVAGKVVVEDGRVTTVDEAALKAEAREHARRFAGNQSEVDRAAEALSPYYRKMYLRAAGRDVGMNRWGGDAAQFTQYG
ncbi:MAG TPA: amidohydrolase family protein [Alphaproteobacteria bacterium]|jgi:5-methylthioadenosine/S-adenosylhomocysteine deaminase|nr:amidohydrolase family protein [Alphaproteobacteria bacterium]